MATIRIVMAGLGGIAGFVTWYAVVTSFGMWPLLMQALYGHSRSDQRLMIYFVGSMLLSGFGAGALVLLLGEKLRLFPSPEELDRQARPVSLFSEEDQDRGK
jgi:hypothetical protein